MECRPMKSEAPFTRDKLDRRAWSLLGLTFIVVIALAAAVPLLYLPQASILWEGSGGEPVRDAYLAVVGLIGLVIIFCLYTALKQRELDAMRRRLEQEEREKANVGTRLSELSALFQLSTTLNLQLKLEDILEIIVRRVVSTLQAQQASIMILDPETNLLETRASYGLESEFARHARKKLGEGIAGWVAQRREPVQLDSGATMGVFQSQHKVNRNITSALSLPLLIGERCVGVLNVNRINHPETFQDHHRDVLQLFAEHVGSVIERAGVMERLGSRARELEAVNLKLNEMNHLKDVFLSTASHELKTPLTSVIGYAELLDDNGERMSCEQRGEFLRRLRAEAGRLLSLIEDILDLTRIESGKLTLRCVSMSANEVAHTAVETTRSLAQKHGVELVERLDPLLPHVALDEVKMRQVLVNLLVNAVKFSPEDGKVVLETLRDGDFLRVHVTDQGEGIAPDDSAHIFELFGQGVRGARAGGLGIGLHLVKRITELHGGHVGVNSRVGEGSTFWLRLPLRSAESPEQVEAAREAA
ncbi:MAG: GAF domain-containing protein [Gemmatimonadales bacterium]|nr:MAG: GAF domain-containing protein [Gemmatimonadales bacterium]